MTIQQIREQAKCCVCDQSLITSENFNIVALDKFATWQYPVVGNLETGDKSRAVAYLCDHCVRVGCDGIGNYVGERPIKYAIEHADSEIIYHPVNELHGYFE